MLTNRDIIEIIKYLIRLINSKATVDDIDHLSNRRVRTVGEQLANQFSVGLSRMARTIPSGEPNRKKVATVTWDQVKEIAQSKMPDLNAFTLKSAMKMVAGTARSMGIKVQGEFPENV